MVAVFLISLYTFPSTYCVLPQVQARKVHLRFGQPEERCWAMGMPDMPLLLRGVSLTLINVSNASGPKFQEFVWLFWQLICRSPRCTVSKHSWTWSSHLWVWTDYNFLWAASWQSLSNEPRWVHCNLSSSKSYPFRWLCRGQALLGGPDGCSLVLPVSREGHFSVFQ